VVAGAVMDSLCPAVSADGLRAVTH
jgi:hypothetical protein